MSTEAPTATEIAAHYAASLDSVTLITELMALDSRDTEQTDTVSRNGEHLPLMVAKLSWTSEDHAPLNAAITAGQA